jgi:hypothetical protein
MEEKSEIKTEVSHLVHASFPKLIPFTIIKNIDVPANKNETT